MNENMTAVSKSDPLMIAWEAFKTTADFDNMKRWAQGVSISNSRDDTATLQVRHPNLEGSLWAMFVAGWNARGSVSAPAPQETK